MSKINRKLLPVKAHYFFFMGALGPILPQLAVYGKELGIPPKIMGSITGILPIVFLLAKPLFGMVVDAFRRLRLVIFMVLIALMSISFSALYFIPATFFSSYEINNATCHNLRICSATDIEKLDTCDNRIRKVTCLCKVNNDTLDGLVNPSSRKEVETCFFINTSLSCDITCNLECKLQQNYCLENTKFWSFVILVAIGTILFNVINSISDAICFDVIGEEHDYGQQRVWGTIGWGIAALLSGFVVDWWSPSAAKSFTPAFLIMIVFTIFDLLSCVKLKLPRMEPPKNILKDLYFLLSNKNTFVYLVFATLAGTIDGFLVYFLFWYLEDLAMEVHTSNVKLVEGLVVAAETMGIEILIFPLVGKIVEKVGYPNCISICFVNYAIRCVLISVVPSPWWIIPVEFFMQGLTFALTYTAIVIYANSITPPSMSATTQGIASGCNDGLGYAIGSMLGGFLYTSYGGRTTFEIFAYMAVLCSFANFMIYKFCMKDNVQSHRYGSPGDVTESVANSL